MRAGFPGSARTTPNAGRSSCRRRIPRRMKRLLLPASALVLVVTACGAGAKPAPRVTEVGARVRSVHVVAARRERAAAREARKLLREFVPPPGARRAPRRDAARQRRRPAPVGTGPALRRGGGRAPLLARREAVPRRPRVRAGARSSRVHAPRRGVRNPEAHYLTRSLESGGRRPIRYLDETVDALPVSPPGVAVSCPYAVAPDLTLSFRSAGGARLAQATLPRTEATLCDPIAFTIGGWRRRPLIDGPGESFVRRLQGLLGLRLVQARR